MDDAQGHRADQNHGGITHRRKDAGQDAPALGLAENFADLLKRIPEEAACEGANDKGRDAAVEQQPAEGQRPFARFDLRHGDDRRDHHHQAVSHVRHHQPVEQDEEGRHQRVRVNPVIGRE